MFLSLKILLSCADMNYTLPSVLALCEWQLERPVCSVLVLQTFHSLCLVPEIMKHFAYTKFKSVFFSLVYIIGQVLVTSQDQIIGRSRKTFLFMNMKKTCRYQELKDVSNNYYCTITNVKMYKFWPVDVPCTHKSTSYLHLYRLRTVAMRSQANRNPMG